MLSCQLLKFIFLLGLLNFQVSFGLKCEFPEENYHAMFETNDDHHFCRIVDESSEIEQNFKTEFISYVEYNGENLKSEDVTLTNLGYPVCNVFSSAQHLIMSHIKSVDKNVLKNCKNLLSVQISFTDMEEIQENYYSDNLSLEAIILTFNKFSTLPEKIFSNLELLEKINLAYNEITSLPSNIFKSLPSLKRIYLYNNKIQTLNPELFNGVVKLTTIWLDDNEISDIPKNMFTSLVNLESLNLRKNNLTIIHSDSFGIHKSLTDVVFYSNQINAIDEKFFDNTAIESYFRIDFSDNVCIEDVVNNKGQNMREEFKKCFENYKPREE